MRAHKRWGKAAVGLLAGGSLLMAGMVPGTSAQTPAAAPQSDCPAAFPVSQLSAGQEAVGYTVSQGRTPEQFGAEILGVLKDGVGPGRDMIIVETSGPAIDKARGIWFGMSGSPIYLDGKLVGAVAFGLSFGPSKLAGVTPAEDMYKVLDYPSGDGGFAPRTVKLTKQQSATIARRAGMSADQVSEFERLKVPVGFSGLNARGLDQVREMAAERKLGIIPYQAGSASGDATQAVGTMHAGDNFAAALSYGDVTAAGVGTVTAVCAGKVLAFGHPFFFQGDTTMGANQADAITIWDDPVFSSFKLANIAEGVGTVDQDRLAAIRATAGVLPTTIPVTSTVTALNNGNSRQGETNLVLLDELPFLAFIHMFTNIDVTFDEIGPGSATFDWSVTGTTESGETFELNRSNMFVSEYDISFGSLFEMLEYLFMLRSNSFEEVEFTGFNGGSEIDDEQRQYTITELRVSQHGGKFVKAKRLFVRRGEKLRLRATLQPYDGTDTTTVDLTVRVPRNVRFETLLQVTGGNPYGGSNFYCFRARCKDEQGNKIESLDDLIAAMENASMNNEVRALVFGRRSETLLDSEAVDQVVLGRKRIRLLVEGRTRPGASEPGHKG